MKRPHEPERENGDLRDRLSEASFRITQDLDLTPRCEARALRPRCPPRGR
ncbi:MAG: hypothetical protein OXN19_16015 [Caldilineaceae bacterium]|nr:hypothetical protein [Caldilineaceae bacterium]